MAIETLGKMIETLTFHGERYTGNKVEDEAQDWLDHGFDESDADVWCAIGVWDAGVAAQLRDAGLTPERVQMGSESLVEDMSYDEQAEAYTDGDPIYSVCNSDTNIAVLIDAARRVTA